MLMCVQTVKSVTRPFRGSIWFSKLSRCKRETGYVCSDDIGLALTDKTRLDRRSVIVASDEGSKTGTFIDKELVKKDSRELKHKEHIIYIGKYPYPLECVYISWQSWMR